MLEKSDVNEYKILDKLTRKNYLKLSTDNSNIDYIKDLLKQADIYDLFNLLEFFNKEKQECIYKNTFIIDELESRFPGIKEEILEKLENITDYAE